MCNRTSCQVSCNKASSHSLLASQVQSNSFKGMLAKVFLLVCNHVRKSKLTFSAVSSSVSPTVSTISKPDLREDCASCWMSLGKVAENRAVCLRSLGGNIDKMRVMSGLHFRESSSSSGKLPLSGLKDAKSTDFPRGRPQDCMNLENLDIFAELSLITTS